MDGEGRRALTRAHPHRARPPRGDPTALLRGSDGRKTPVPIHTKARPGPPAMSNSSGRCARSMCAGLRVRATRISTGSEPGPGLADLLARPLRIEPAQLREQLVDERIEAPRSRALAVGSSSISVPRSGRKPPALGDIGGSAGFDGTE